MKTPLFYHKRPIFGLDIGSQTVKFLQLESHKTHASVKAYGSVETDLKITSGGLITNIPKAAKLVDSLLSNNMQGTLTTNRVVMSIPVSRVFTRVLTLPQMSRRELQSAMQLEVEQSVPMAVKNLYYDYETTNTGDSENMLVRIVAAPRDIVDSYTEVCDMLGLDLTLVQTNIEADAQLCMKYEDLIPNSPYIIVDVGGDSIDVGILDETLRVTGTVDAGGNSLTQAIAKALHLSPAKANEIKVKQGIGAGANQQKIKDAVSPILDKVTLEIKRMSRFYEERVREGGEISQILIVGGGANMPGLGDYLTDAMHTPTRVSSPWSKFVTFGKLEPPEHADLPRFLTCAGLALAEDKEVFES
jgi:type IV pilus assembly protein PilM